jgi:hypothetical protein
LTAVEAGRLKLSEQPWVRTGLPHKPKKLSEVVSSSDRFITYSRKAVRRNTEFGQVYRIFRKSCPKYRRVRTGLPYIHEKPSEVTLGSDRLAVYSVKAVQSNAEFGQVSRKFQKISPK